jgi:hypothetical protein
VTLHVAINPLGGAAPAASLGCVLDTPTSPAVTVGVDGAGGINPTSGMFAVAGPPSSYIMLTTLDGDNQESIRVGSFNAAATPPTITACFSKPHAADTVLSPLGGFATGIIPPLAVYPNGSTDSILKLYGDINGDGNMVYVEYTCDTAARNLYRKVTPLGTAKTALTDADILLSNILVNPGGTACFTYQLAPNSPIIIQGIPLYFVLDVAVTLTVETQQVDPVTKRKQTETKALLNVSPRNVYNSWALASIGYTDRIQSTPVSVTGLLPALP